MEMASVGQTWRQAPHATQAFLSTHAFLSPVLILVANAEILPFVVYDFYNYSV